jgi:hypothetical protein
MYNKSRLEKLKQVYLEEKSAYLFELKNGKKADRALEKKYQT